MSEIGDIVGTYRVIDKTDYFVLISDVRFEKYNERNGYTTEHRKNSENDPFGYINPAVGWIEDGEF